MNAMIPNKVRFDLNLNDLPTRAIQVSYNELSLSGTNLAGVLGDCKRFNMRANGGKGLLTRVNEYPENLAEQSCGTICGSAATFVGLYRDRDYIGEYYFCLCCWN